jgi:cell wall-associated NlpC family hydrolase
MMMMDLSQHATARHRAARYVGMPWSKEFDCWALVQAVQADLYGRALPDVPVGSGQDQTAALLLATQGWSRVDMPAADGDVLTVFGKDGLHVGVIVDGRLLHNMGGVRADGSAYGSVRVDALDALGGLGFGHPKLWRADA